MFRNTDLSDFKDTSTKYSPVKSALISLTSDSEGLSASQAAFVSTGDITELARGWTMSVARHWVCVCVCVYARKARPSRPFTPYCLKDASPVGRAGAGRGPNSHISIRSLRIELVTGATQI